MKHRIILSVLTLLSILQVQATDVIFGNCHYREIEGRYAGFRKTESSTTFETDDRITLVYCLRIPRATVSATATLTPKVTGDVTLNILVKNCETDEVLLRHTATQACTRSKNVDMEIIPETNFPADTWYRVEIQAPDGYNRISRLIQLNFERSGSNPVVDAHLRGFPTPATHLWMGHSTAPGAPQNESYEWCYQEVLMPKQWATINTYLMTLGITGGYMGIQMAGKTVPNENGQYTDTIPSSYWKQALFSIWDDGDMDQTPDLATYLRAGALAWGDDVTINHFGAEGTGCQAMISHAKWEPGQWVQFLTCARPEERTIILKDKDKNDSIIRYPCSLLSAWYKTTDDPEWHYMATIRHSGESHYWNSWYSFIENWADSGGELFRRAYYRNNYQRSVGSGKWYFINKASFSQTTYQDFINSGEITTRHRRVDYGHGLASDVPRAYYMQTGGYGQPKDSANTLPLVDDHSVVESINLDSLLATLKKAYLADSQNSMTGLISTHSTTAKIKELVKELFERENRFEGYSSEALKPIHELATTNYTLVQMRRALNEMVKEHAPLRYGNTVKAEHICSFRAYQIGDDANILAVRNKQLVGIPRDEADVTDPANHWIILRHDDETTYCVYNLATGYYLTIKNNAELSEVPTKLTISFSRGRFVIRESTRSLCFDDNGQPMRTTVANASSFEFLDNYYLTPKSELVNSLLEQTTSSAIATAIDEIQKEDILQPGEENTSLSDDIAGVYYYDLQGRQIGYALQPGQTVIAHIVLRNGASIVRKIVVGK